MKKLLLSIIIGIAWFAPVIPMEMEYETEPTDRDINPYLYAELQKLRNEYTRLRALQNKQRSEHIEYTDSLKEQVLLLWKNKSKLVAQIIQHDDDDLFGRIFQLNQQIYGSFYEILGAPKF